MLILGYEFRFAGFRRERSRCTSLTMRLLFVLLLSICTSTTTFATSPGSKLQVELASLDNAEKKVVLHGKDARWQLLITEQEPGSPAQQRDATRRVKFSVDPPNVAHIDATGMIVPKANGRAQIIAQLDDSIQTSVALEVSGLDVTHAVNFPNQVVPIFTKLGCNGGGCHGKAAGQAGFKLSLLGFEPRDDYRHLVEESRGRRLFPANPAQSLLLQKAINTAPHGGGQRLEANSDEYRLLERWIAGGMHYGSDDDPVVTRIEVLPNQRRLAPKETQQLSVLAHYSDGHIEDISRTAQYESNNSDLAEVTTQGLVTLGEQVGDVSIMARYQGQVGVFTASIPLGVEVEKWPVAKNRVDELVYAKLKTLGIPPSQACDDSTFLRRVTLDLTGRLPTIEETQQFLSSQDPQKDSQVVDQLLESMDHAEFFARKWVTILRNRRTSPGHQFGTYAFHSWLRDSFFANKAYDQLVRELITATGSVETNPPVAWLREVSTTEARVEDSAQLFLGQRLQCARCHHHPFEKWSQQDYFQMAAFFSKVQRKDGAQPEEPMFVSRMGGASARHPKTGKSLLPAGLNSNPITIKPVDDPRVNLVDWMVAPDNPFFARALVNRYWKHFFHTGLVEPEDDLRVTNPPTNPALLNGLAEYFVEQEYDLKALLRLICNSNVYRLSSLPNSHNLNDNNTYSRFYPKRMQSEVLLDAINQVALTHTSFDGMPVGTRAVSLPDTSFASYFLDVFGEPDSATACECERATEATLAQSLHLLNSKEVQSKLTSDEGLAASLAASSDPPKLLVNQLYLSALSRKATETEIATATSYLEERKDRRREAFEDLIWAVLNSKEFLFIH